MLTEIPTCFAGIESLFAILALDHFSRPGFSILGLGFSRAKALVYFLSKSWELTSFYGNMLYSLLSPFDALNEGTKEKAYPLLKQVPPSSSLIALAFDASTMAVPSSNTAYSSAPSMEYCSKCHFLSLLLPLVNYATKINSTVSRFTAERTRETRNYKQMQEEEGLYRAKSKG
ncbi:hypothetical protein MTR_4g035690 [Medicago truncatula]|uniref:Uncharacterized protein n=1 Tax=Medicago truncatula TaxID=3880 RepID=A0A072UI59_MEDTR|nr:hypothetical protein MTR_4g035690 [Medicago truncatula]